MLHTLKAAPGSRKRRKRIGRGNAAGGGTTAGRGTKGQAARTGKGRRFGFEGGQTPIIRRQPKLGGFRSPQRVAFEVLNLADLESSLEPGAYDVEALKAQRLISKGNRVKLLGRGEVKKKFEITVHAASASAKAAIEKAGGRVTLLD